MTKDVLVSIRGLQNLGGDNENECDSVETIYPGEYYFRNGTHYILYEEAVENMEESIKNMIKIKDKEFVLTKKGPVNVQMVFNENKKTMTDYVTPFGNILIAFDTTGISVVEEDEKLTVHIDYALEANYQFVADCNVCLEVKSK